jgi:hypothetical protein
LITEVAERMQHDSGRLSHPLRVLLDAPRAADPFTFATLLVDRLRAGGRPAGVVRADAFWRDASLRLEYGHTDVDSYLSGWIDTAALTREVLEPLGPGGRGDYLPALRDARTNRSVRSQRHAMDTPGLVVVAGDLLLGRGLPADLSIHVVLSPATRARRTPPEQRWMLSALDRYDEIDPATLADVVITWNDPLRPAVRQGT